MTSLNRDLQAAQAKAATLIEALPWLARFHGATIVVKYGGNAMTDPSCSGRSPRTWCSCATPVSDRWWCTAEVRRSPRCSTRLGMASEFRGGLRVTTPEAMDIVRMVLVGQVGRELVGLINEHGPFAVGLSGEDAGLFTAVRRPAYVDGEPVDVGQVGDVAKVDISAVSDLIAAGRIPVISSVAPDADGVRVQRQRRYRRGRARRGVGRPQACGPHRCTRRLRRLAGPGQPRLADLRRRAGRAAAAA